MHNIDDPDLEQIKEALEEVGKQEVVHEHNPLSDLPEALQHAIVKEMQREARLVGRLGGHASFIPSLGTFNKDDIKLLLLSARHNGGILPIKVRLGLMQHMTEQPPQPDMHDPKYIAAELARPRFKSLTRNQAKAQRRKNRV